MSEITPVTPPVTVQTPPALELRDMALQGRLDGAAVLKLRDQVNEALQDRPANILVDISGVTQVTASGLAGVLELLHLARSRGGDVRLYGVSLAIADAQEASRLTAVTRIYVRRDLAAQGGPARPPQQQNNRARRRPVQVLRGIVETKRTHPRSEVPAQPAVADQATTQAAPAPVPSQVKRQSEAASRPTKETPTSGTPTKAAPAQAGVNQ
jgi:anti-sigma B factor antagonist